MKSTRLFAHPSPVSVPVATEPRVRAAPLREAYGFGPVTRRQAKLAAGSRSAAQLAPYKGFPIRASPFSQPALFGG
jgi:hypothetical protein